MSQLPNNYNQNVDADASLTSLCRFSCTYLRSGRHQHDLTFERVRAGQEILLAGDQDGAYHGMLRNGGYFAAVCDFGYCKSEVTANGILATNQDGFFKIEVGDRTYIAVADGISQDPGGEMACFFFLHTLKTHLSCSDDPKMAIRKAAESLELAHKRMPETKQGESNANMGTCFLLAEIGFDRRGKYVQTYHCGDVAALLIRGDETFRTKDHTLAQRERIKPNHPDFRDKSNTVTRFAGIAEGKLMEEKLIIDVSKKRQLDPKDQFLIATDGMWDVMPSKDSVRNICRNTRVPADLKQTESINNLHAFVSGRIADDDTAKRDNECIVTVSGGFE